MRILFEFKSKAARERWLNDLQGSKLGYVIHSVPGLAFSPVHRVLSHPEDGPTILLDNTVFELLGDEDVYPTKAAAEDAFYRQP